MATNKNSKAKHCIYCNITLPDKNALKRHCQTESHQITVMSDEGHDWFYRPPPRCVDLEDYKLCERWHETGTCYYSHQCIEAHGEAELAEWKERKEYRCMKMKRANEKKLFGMSYTEKLIKKWLESTNPEMVMSENSVGVEHSHSDQLNTTISTKNSTHEWSFWFKAYKQLKAVALLQDSCRNHFYLKEITTRAVCEKLNAQEWIFQGKDEVVDDILEHHVTVAFKTEIFGTFRQTVIFDFGQQPVLAKHICVDVVPIEDIEKVNEVRSEIRPVSERWNPENADILEFTSSLQIDSSFERMWHKQLQSIYACPTRSTFHVSQATINDKKFTKNNYKTRMHELLTVEEIARTELISQYNLFAKLLIARSYILAPNSTVASTAKYSAGGELFALLPLSKELSEDSAEGRLILKNCRSILLAPHQFLPDPTGKRRVYEALIEDRCKSTIYIRLSAATVTELNLQPDQEITLHVQFQLNRISYCEWHYAVDKLHDTKCIFPDVDLEPRIPWSPAKQWAPNLDKRLNVKQKEAIIAITTPKNVRLPPLLIIGPYGTGKTFTLAQAIRDLMQQPDNRVLVCTHSNSAADLYIKDYLHPLVKRYGNSVKPLRIYYHNRWVSTVNPIVQKYALITKDGGTPKFAQPTLKDIQDHRVIVMTLSLSLQLLNLNVPRGHFTHILLDEAAQALECEAVMALALADENTRIVLAGDHMQLNPDMFSPFARERKLHVSLLERLHDDYPTSFPCKIMLCENYRAHEAIIDFTSETFYEQKLVTNGKVARHHIYYPLSFFVTRGEDVQDQNSTAFYNNSEVYEVVERVADLMKNWPKAWGKIDEQSIGIVTPYADQVFRIRSELRKRKMAEVSVERVLNVQGKQFRAIFLSTVRTRRTCVKQNPEESDFGFLSNSKLLNTAITRAQSLVAVVGDPVALCSIGRCSKIWEKFLQTCEENKSLYGMTWSFLKNQLDGIELRKIYTLNPLAPVFVPRRSPEMRPVLPPPGTEPFLAYSCVFPAMRPFTPMPITPFQPNFMMFPPPQPIPQFVQNIIPIPPRFTGPNLRPIVINPNYRRMVPVQKQKPQPKKPGVICDGALGDYLKLLPDDMSLVDMILQPDDVLICWYEYLLLTKGTESAEKFSYLMESSRKSRLGFPITKINFHQKLVAVPNIYCK